MKRGAATAFIVLAILFPATAVSGRGLVSHIFAVAEPQSGAKATKLGPSILKKITEFHP